MRTTAAMASPTAPDGGTRGRLFREALERPNGRGTLVELVPWAGTLAHDDAERHLATARALVADWRVTALTVTDNAGGHIRLSPSTVGRALRDLGADVVVHISCRERSRGALASLAWDLASLRTVRRRPIKEEQPTGEQP